MFSMSAPDPRSLQLAELTQYAYRLGMAFGAAAEQSLDDANRQLEYFQLFERCFFSVRMGISLELRLGRPPVREMRAGAEGSERESPERERAERERREATDRSLDMSREREREREPASLPLLLKTLTGVADAASGLPGPVPAALPSQRELLARLSSDPATSPDKSPSGPTNTRPGLRARLATSAATPIPALPSRPSPVLALRRATGPPHR